jgi:hypothetical protein
MARKATDFRTILKDDGTLTREGWNDFLRFIDSKGGTERTEIVKIVKQVGSGGGLPTPGGGGSGSTPQSPAPQDGLIVANTIGADRGMFVNYGNETLQKADCRYRPATHWVSVVDAAGRCILRAIGDGFVLLASGDGLSNNTTLYLYQDGKATDDESKIVANGRPQNSSAYHQIVGFRSGPKATTACVGSVHIFPWRKF